MRTKIMLALTAALLVAACEDGVGPDDMSNAATVTVTPGEATLVVGESRSLSVTVRAADGSVLVGNTVAWESSDEAVAEVSPNGVVTALSSGSSRITARSGGKRGEARVAVSTPPVEDVVLDWNAITLQEGDELQVTATPRDADGNPIAGLGIQWISSAPEIASVGSLGTVTAVRPGRAAITARVNGKEASAEVTVSAEYQYDLIYTVASGGAHGLHEIFRLDIRQDDPSPGRLFPVGEWASQPAPSPDGSRIAFVCASDFGDPGICSSDRNGGDRALIAWYLGESLTEPTWSRDGTRLAFTRTTYQVGGGSRSRIWVMGVDGANPVGLTAEMEGSQSAPAWSPTLADGTQRIAFSSGSSSEQRIWSMRSDGSDVRPVTATEDVLDTGPAWSPDGSMIAYQRISATVRADVWAVSAAGGEERSLSGPLAGAQAAPAWSPDGRLVAFVSSHETYGNGTLSYQVYTVWSDGSKLARRTFDGNDKAQPAWLARP